MNPILGPWGDLRRPPAGRPSLWRRLVLALCRIFAPFFGIALGLLATYQIEMAAWPVVTNFAVTSIVKVPSAYQVTGSYTKARSCELISTSLLAFNAADATQPGKLLYQIKHQDPGANLPVGLVMWGPYTIQAPDSFGDATHIRVTSLHRCHPLWLHESHYTTVPIAGLPG